MRRALIIGIASLFIAALVAPTAQADTRRYDFQDYQPADRGHVAIHIVVVDKNKQRHGPYTPRRAGYSPSFRFAAIRQLAPRRPPRALPAPTTASS